LSNASGDGTPHPYFIRARQVKQEQSPSGRTAAKFEGKKTGKKRKTSPIAGAKSKKEDPISHATANNLRKPKETMSVKNYRRYGCHKSITHHQEGKKNKKMRQNSELTGTEH